MLQKDALFGMPKKALGMLMQKVKLTKVSDKCQCFYVSSYHNACEEGNAAAIWRVGANGLEFVGPIGIRDMDGNIVPLSDSQVQAPEPTIPVEALYEGVTEKVPRHVGQLVCPIFL
jgi:hypothetical protein